MKLVKTASGKKTVKISKKEWQSIGERSSWLKEAQYDEIDYDKIRKEKAKNESDKQSSGYRKAPIPDACGTCVHQSVDRGLYSCGLYGFNVSLSNICDSYEKDPSKKPIT